MTKPTKIEKGDVAWVKPKGKKPVCYSTIATSDVIASHAGSGWTWNDMARSLDPDVRRVAKVMVEHKLGKIIPNCLQNETMYLDLPDKIYECPMCGYAKYGRLQWCVKDKGPMIVQTFEEWMGFVPRPGVTMKEMGWSLG